MRDREGRQRETETTQPPSDLPTLARSLSISIAFSTQHSIHHSEAKFALDQNLLEAQEKQSLVKLPDKETFSMLSRRAAPTAAPIPTHITVQSTDRLQ